MSCILAKLFALFAKPVRIMTPAQHQANETPVAPVRIMTPARHAGLVR